MADLIRRHAVRALILATDTRRVLLIQMWVPDSDTLIWITPGGGIEPGETSHTALIREVYEETGLRTLTQAQLSKQPIWQRRMRFALHNEDYDQSEDIHLLRVKEFTPSASHNPAAKEAQSFRRFKWWSVNEIAQSDDLFVPRTFALHLTRLLNDGHPDHPIDVGT